MIFIGISLMYPDAFNDILVAVAQPTVPYPLVSADFRQCLGWDAGVQQVLR